MKIAVWHNLMSGGAKRALFYHVRGMVERGHKVEIWCPDSAHTGYLPLSDFAKEHVLPLNEEYDAIMQQPRRKGFGWMEKRINAVKRHCAACATQINQGGFDVLFANSCCYFYMSHLGPFVNIPKVIYLGEPYRWLYEASPLSAWIAPPRIGWASLTAWRQQFDDAKQIHGNRIQVREEYYSATSYDLILVNSRYSRESVLRAYGLESKVCHLGIDTSLFKKQQETKEPYIIGVGYLYPAKGIDRTIRALASIPKAQRPPLIWVANGYSAGYDTEIKKLAADLDVCLEIRIGIPDTDLVSLLSKAAVMAYTPRLEPFGFVPLEANACGTAVVGIAEAGVRESVVHGINGLLADDDNPELLAKMIAPFTDNLAYATTFGEASRQYVIKHWSLERAINNIEHFLLTVVNASL